MPCLRPFPSKGLETVHVLFMVADEPDAFVTSWGHIEIDAAVEGTKALLVGIAVDINPRAAFAASVSSGVGLDVVHIHLRKQLRKKPFEVLCGVCLPQLTEK